MDRNLRECRPCTACCDGWLAITVEGYDSYPGHPCPHSTGSGCDDYVNRPIEPCVNFTCGWAMNNSPLPEWMKPSEAKVVVIPKKMRNNQSVLLATPLGVSIPEKSLDWLIRFSDEYNLPLLYTEQIMENGRFTKRQNFRIHGPTELKQQILEWAESGEMLA